MAKREVQTGSTGHRLLLFITNSSTGAGLTGLAYNTSGLACGYKRNADSAAVAVTLVTITTLGTYVSGGFKEVSASLCPGFYEFHPPDAAFASGSGSVAFELFGAANMVPLPLEMELTAWNNQDGVRGGMTALPNAAAASTGGLPTVDSTNSVKVQSPLKKGVATGFPFQMLDSSGNPKTGLTVTTTISKDDAAFGATTNAATELGNGWYWISFTATEMNANAVVFHASATGANNTDLTLLMVP